MAEIDNDLLSIQEARTLATQALGCAAQISARHASRSGPHLRGDGAGCSRRGGHTWDKWQPKRPAMVFQSIRH